MGNGGSILWKRFQTAIVGHVELTLVNSLEPAGGLGLPSMPDDVIANIRARIAQCRRLADLITDDQTAAILRQMADDGESDLRRLEGGKGERSDK